MEEKHILIDGEVASGSLVDAGLYLFHNIKRTLSHGTGPYFYLPKLENYMEARLWDEVFAFSEQELGVTHGTIKATVLLETILAAFEIEEIIYELREHMAGINAGRWDYMFSAIKKFRHEPGFLWPDRAQVTMTAPMMRAYTELMVQTCHKRGAHAIGGMAAFIPNRRDPEVTAQALSKVKEDKRREANDGCDGTWVAHPDLVTVAEVEFNAILGQGPNQVDRLRPDVVVSADDLLAVDLTGGTLTRSGLTTNVYVSLRYLASWLSGSGAAAINNLMEDAATAEISRSQIWQWIRHSSSLEDDTIVTADLVRREIANQMVVIADELGSEAFAELPFEEARRVFEQVTLASEFVEFLTLPAYELLD